MHYQRLLGSIITVGLGMMAAASCSSTTGGGGGGMGTGATGTGALKWYTTCGDPVCMDSDAGTTGGPAACTTEKAGDACTTAGAQCDPGGGCHVYLICATADPKLNPGGCPISRARYKKEIDYVSDGKLQSLHDELMTMRLSTWRYTSENATDRQHLGFIIDDNPESPSVDASGEKVDLYGYTSMAVAAAQVQNRRIEALERELAALRRELAAVRAQNAR